MVDVEELDRVFDRDDVLPARAVDVADQGGERRRLPRAGRPGDEEQSALLVAKALNAGRQPQLVEAGHLGRDHAEGERGRASLPEAVDPKAGQVGCHVRGVELAGLAEVLEPVRRTDRDALEDRLEVGLGERLPAFERAQVAVAAHDRRQAELEVDVSGAAFDDSFQESVEVYGQATLTIGSGLASL